MRARMRALAWVFFYRVMRSCALNTQNQHFALLFYCLVRHATTHSARRRVSQRESKRELSLRALGPILKPACVFFLFLPNGDR